ncbi:MAG: hypothetical protein WEA09_03320 [Gemmatimonadota bacterium]
MQRLSSSSLGFILVSLLLGCGGGDAPSTSEEEPGLAMEAPGTDLPMPTRPMPGEATDLSPPAVDSSVQESDTSRVPPTFLTDTSPPPPLEPTIRPELAAPSIPAGTAILLTLEEGVSRDTHGVGDAFYARVAEEVLAGDGMILLPEGSRVQGRVISWGDPEASPESDVVLEIRLERLELPTGSRAITATLLDEELGSELDPGTPLRIRLDAPVVLP